MLADEVRFVVGVDTHRDAHTLAVVAADSRRSRGEVTVAACRRGYRRALRVACRKAPGRRVWALEGSGCYGAGLARFLTDRGEEVVEVERPLRQGRQGRLKSDALDAERAARLVLAGTVGSTPRSSRETQALRALLTAREGAVRACTAALNELRAEIVIAPAELRERLQGKPEGALLAACARLRGTSNSGERAAYALTLRSLATRIRNLRAEAKQLEREISRRVHVLAPDLLARRGIGPISAATILIAWSHPGRIRSEAAFARLAGVAPIPASSGQTVRFRLDRGGDRRLNRALHTIVLTLQRIDPATRAYIDRRLSDGKTQREAVRCLKRYLARSLYRQLEATPMT